MAVRAPALCPAHSRVPPWLADRDKGEGDRPLDPNAMPPPPITKLPVGESPPEAVPAPKGDTLPNPTPDRDSGVDRGPGTTSEGGPPPTSPRLLTLGPPETPGTPLALAAAASAVRCHASRLSLPREKMRRKVLTLFASRSPGFRAGAWDRDAEALRVEGAEGTRGMRRATWGASPRPVPAPPCARALASPVRGLGTGAASGANPLGVVEPLAGSSVRDGRLPLRRAMRVKGVSPEGMLASSSRGEGRWDRRGGGSSLTSLQMDRTTSDTLLLPGRPATQQGGGYVTVELAVVHTAQRAQETTASGAAVSELIICSSLGKQVECGRVWCGVMRETEAGGGWETMRWKQESTRT